MSTDEITVKNATGEVLYDSRAEKFKRLREQFPAEHVGKLPRGKAKGAPKGKCLPRSQGGDAPNDQDFFCGKWHALPAVHLDYVGHAAVTDRLIEVDPEWNWEPVVADEHGRPAFERDGRGNPIGLWIRLTLLGVTRLGYGSVEVGKFDPEKQLIGDALRNAAMRFGVALDMWIKGHADEEDEREAAPVAPAPDPVLVGWSNRAEAVEAHGELRELIGQLSEPARKHLDEWRDANGLTAWPLPYVAFEAFTAEVSILVEAEELGMLDEAPGAPEALSGPDGPPKAPEAETGAQAQPPLPSDANAPLDTADPTAPDLETGHCAQCGGPIWFHAEPPAVWLHADLDDQLLAHEDPILPAGPGIDVDALYAATHPVKCAGCGVVIDVTTGSHPAHDGLVVCDRCDKDAFDPQQSRATIEAEVGALSQTKLLKAIVDAKLPGTGSPKQMRDRLVEHRLAVLASSA